MKNKLLILLFLSAFLVSCFGGLPFDPRLYNKDFGDLNDDTLEPDTVPPTTTTPDNDPFLFDENNDPSANGFTPDKFDEWTLYAYFDAENLPQYQFRIHKSWTTGDTSKNEYLLSGETTTTEATGSKLEITDVTYYKYKGKNDNFEPDSEYNTKPINGVVRMERFLFYRFYGKAPIVGNVLDNRVMAVDTMTKLIYLYSKPTDFDELVGQYVPKKWRSVDQNTVINGVRYPFYEYDPIGFVNADGSVNFFQWYIDDAKAAGNGNDHNKYNPRIYPTDKNRKIASASVNGEGRSPYFVFPSEDEDEEKDLFLSAVGMSEFLYRKMEYGYSDILNKYSFSFDGKTLEFIASKWNGDESKITYTHKSTISDTEAIYIDESKNEVKLNLTDTNTKLNKDDIIVGEIGFVDKGPLFADRVKGLTFKSGGKNIEFSSDGKTMTASGYSWQLLYGGNRNGTYNLTIDESGEAAFKKSSGSPKFVAIKVDDTSSKVQWSTIGYNNDSDIKFGMVLYSDDFHER